MNKSDAGQKGIADKSVEITVPATVSNVGCGFDILGFAVCEPTEIVKLSLKEEPGIEIINSTDLDLSLNADKNTAGIALKSLLEHLGTPETGFTIEFLSKYKIGGGMGSSAASAVGAVVGAVHLLEQNIPLPDLLPFCMKGEHAASMGAHPDNVVPALLGGFCLVRNLAEKEIIQLPIPGELMCTLVSPEMKINTSEARKILKKEADMEDVTQQVANMGAFVSALYTENLELMGRSVEDLIVEPQRRHLIPGYDDVKSAALNAGALACNISGAGPTLFALSRSGQSAEHIGRSMVSAWKTIGIKADYIVTTLSENGATITG
jgi:homoserine kinase